MAGRGDKNKKSTSGRGSSNQSNQPFGNSAEQKSNREKRTTGGSPSRPDQRTFDDVTNRNEGNPAEEMNEPVRGAERNFSLLVDSVPYLVHAAPFDFNGEIRYRVSVNGNEEHVFTWDSELKRLAAIDDRASTLPDSLEEAISGRLQSIS